MRTIDCSTFVALALVLTAQAAGQGDGTHPGDERQAAGVKLCWCPAGRFTMGSPLEEPGHRPDEVQVAVRITRGFWIGKYEVTQGDWKRIAGPLPAKPTEELPEGDDLPVGNANFAQAEEFCRKLTEKVRESGDLPGGWEFRVPTEAQWEYACRAGTTTATAFGSLWLSSHPGTASMGKLLALSLVTTLAAVLLFQPALMGKPREISE